MFKLIESLTCQLILHIIYCCHPGNYYGNNPIQPIHALLYLVVSFLAVSMIFLSLGAPFVAVLEVIVYAGAIIVLFIFVVMMLNLGQDTAAQEKQWLQPKIWIGPSLLALALLVEMIVLLTKGTSSSMNVPVVDHAKLLFLFIVNI